MENILKHPHHWMLNKFGMATKMFAASDLTRFVRHILCAKREKHTKRD